MGVQALSSGLISSRLRPATMVPSLLAPLASWWARRTGRRSKRNAYVSKQVLRPLETARKVFRETVSGGGYLDERSVRACGQIAPWLNDRLQAVPKGSMRRDVRRVVAALRRVGGSARTPDQVGRHMADYQATLEVAAGAARRAQPSVERAIQRCHAYLAAAGGPGDS